MDFKHLALASAIALGSSGAFANNVANDITAASGVTFFGALHTDSDDFIDVFTFNVAGPVQASASLITIGEGLNNIDFISAVLNGVALTLSRNPGDFAEAGVTDAPLDLTGPLVLTVTGKSGAGAGTNASYSGTIVLASPPSATPVPEAETYALMLAGLGVMGFAARRRSV